MIFKIYDRLVTITFQGNKNQFSFDSDDEVEQLYMEIQNIIDKVSKRDFLYGRV